MLLTVQLPEPAKRKELNALVKKPAPDTKSFLYSNICSLASTESKTANNIFAICGITVSQAYSAL